MTTDSPEGVGDDDEQLTSVEGGYSQVADGQLDELEAQNPDLYNDILTMCEFVFTNPGAAQSRSAAVQTTDGIVFRLAVPGSNHKVFWSSDGPRIEAVFPYP